MQAARQGNVPKVADLALRLNAAYGLDMAAWPVAYEAGLAHDWFHQENDVVHLIIGCVDNHLGRREVAQTITAFDGRLWAIDCGNEQNSGQVLIGNLPDGQKIRVDKLGLCSGLPSPYIQEPDLLEPDPEVQTQSCAEMGDGTSLAETQSLMVNRMAATLAAQYTATFVLQRQILQLGSYFNLAPPTIRSQLVTEANLNQYKKEPRL